jgi:hypothetical protein
MDASSSTTTPETLDDIILTHDMENPISSSIVALNQNLHRDVYAMRESIRPSSFITSTKFNHTAFLYLGGKFNACLDSGCTDYIITNRALFQNYDTKGAVEIGTANCGLLKDQAMLLSAYFSKIDTSSLLSEDVFMLPMHL